VYVMLSWKYIYVDAGTIYNSIKTNIYTQLRTMFIVLLSPDLSDKHSKAPWLPTLSLISQPRKQFNTVPRT